MDWQLKYESLSAAVKKLLAAQKDAREHLSVQSKQLKVKQAEREVLEIMDPNKRVVSKAQELFERM